MALCTLKARRFFPHWDIAHDDQMWATQAMKKVAPQFLPLQQAGVRYRWEGEETYGMLERSYHREKITNA